VEHFLVKAAQTLNKQPPVPPSNLVRLLATYDFPGNIRELEALIFNAVACTRSGMLSLESFHFIKPGRSTSSTPVSSVAHVDDCLDSIFGGFPSLKEAGQFLTEEALRRSGGKQGGAAALLGITRQALNKRLKRKS